MGRNRRSIENDSGEWSAVSWGQRLGQRLVIELPIVEVERVENGTIEVKSAGHQKTKVCISYHRFYKKIDENLQ